MEREASNLARGCIGFHHTFRHSFAKGRRGLAQGYLRVLDLLFSHGRLDFLYEALEGTQRRTVTVVPFHSLAGSSNRRFVYDRHSRLL